MSEGPAGGSGEATSVFSLRSGVVLRSGSEELSSSWGLGSLFLLPSASAILPMEAERWRREEGFRVESAGELKESKTMYLRIPKQVILQNRILS